MTQEAPLVLVDALHALLSANATSPSIVEEALLRIATMRRHPAEAYVFGVPTLLEALAHWSRVTGGDDVTDALGRWLDTMDPKTAEGLDRRVLEEVQLLCPRLIPFTAAPREAEDPRFLSYVEKLFQALAESARFASVTVWKSTVANKLRQVAEETGNLPLTSLPSVVFDVARSRTAFGEDDGVRAAEKRVSEAHFTPSVWVEVGSPNSFMDELSVYQERTVVSDVQDPSSEVSIHDLRLGSVDDLQIGEVVSLVDESLTRALRDTFAQALSR